MLSVPAIIGVTVAATALLLTVGVVVGMSFERRRSRRSMHQHSMTRRLSIHRPNLSANENNYEQIPRPNSYVFRTCRPSRVPVWNTVPSEESIAPEPEPVQQIYEAPMQPNAKRRKGLRNSLYGYSLNVPKTRRRKKIQKEISMNQVSQSPLSAITEFMDATEPTMLAELPTETTPRPTPDRKPASPPQLHVVRTRTKTLSQDMAERPFVRSVSMASTMTAPAEPLPPLPTFDIYKSTRHNEPWRNSTTSLDTVGSSVLGAMLSSPKRGGNEITIPNDLDGMQTFDFGFDENRSAARLGVPPGRQTMQGYCIGKNGITSIRPSVEYHGGRSTSLESHNRLRALNDTFRAIGSSDWNESHIPARSATTRLRHSMLEYNSILGKRNYNNDPLLSSPQMIRRPACVASGNPYQWDRKPAFSTVCHSAGSSEAKKGHRRQNCVRITGLPMLEQRNSRISQMPEVQEEQPETPSNPQVKIPGLTLLEAGQPVLRARASLVDVKGSPSPLQNRPILVPNRTKGSMYYRTSDSSLSFPIPDSDVFSTGQPNPRTPETFRHPQRGWPLSPKPANNTKLNSNTASRTSFIPHDSPILPSPLTSHLRSSINATKPMQPRKSLVKGPRSQPPPQTASGLSPRTGSPSPLGNKQNSKRAQDDLRKSIMALRSMNSEGRLLDASSKNYFSIGEEPADIAVDGSLSASGNVRLSPTMGSLINNHRYPRERRYGSVAFGARSKMSIAMSPSGMSLGGQSIWEDASVRGDSPEPEMPTVTSQVLLAQDRQSANIVIAGIVQPQPTTPKLVVPGFDPEAYENMGPGVGGKMWRERERDAFGITYGNISPEGKGLGLRVDGRVLGTPGSLYDGDGFLKE